MIYIKDRVYMILTLSAQERWCPSCKNTDVVLDTYRQLQCWRCGQMTLNKTEVNLMIEGDEIRLISDTGLMFYAGFHND